jgi:two-component system phosphate regulon sensor histidine kinase PhoR
MIELSLILAGLFLIMALWFAWRYFDLRRRVRALSDQLRGIQSGKMDSNALIDASGETEATASVILSLLNGMQARADQIEIERGKLSAILEQMTDGVLIVAADGRVRLFNPAAGRLFDVAIGLSVVEALRYYQLAEVWRKAGESGAVQVEEFEIGTPRRAIQMTAIPLREAGETLLLFQDLTRLRKLEKVRRDFISNISHELRTPLTSLKTLTETLQGALDDRPAVERFLTHMETEVDAMIQIVNELLELARIESGQVSLNTRFVLPALLTQVVYERMALQVERARLSFRMECADDLPAVKADPPRLEQVLVNLIHNAIKFTPAGGEIVIGARGAENAIVFFVRDTGVGIPADDLPRIFERFYKADRARSGGGTGLGLSIARHIVEAHGGKIWVESDEGRGSEFIFQIPY